MDTISRSKDSLQLGSRFWLWCPFSLTKSILRTSITAGWSLIQTPLIHGTHGAAVDLGKGVL